MAEKSRPSIITTEVPFISTSTTPTPPNSSQSSTSSNGFFPWLDDTNDHAGLTSKVLKRFPILGGIGLIGSALTPLLSWLVLFLFNHHKVIDGGHMPKPAAWLSIILSLNSILVHMAVSQGIAVTWWYRASRKTTTVAELHNIWATGSSVVAAVVEWRAFNYIALATVFAATLPINGILLQNAVSSGVSYKNVTAPSTNFSLATELPAGFSADLNPDGTVGTYQTSWQSIIPLVIANAEGMYKDYNENNTCKGTCNADLAGVGFEATCSDSTVPYNLPLDNHLSTASGSSTMFSIDITWNASAPHTIGLNTLYKPDSTCEGLYQVRNCSLRMAKVKYPVELQFNSTGDGLYYWYLMAQSLSPSHKSSIFYPSEVISVYPTTPERNTTAFGGIAEALKSYFTSSIVLQTTSNSTALRTDGIYAEQIQPSSKGYDENGNPIVLANKCNNSFPLFGTYPTPSYAHPSDYMLDQIRTTLFYTSVFAADYYAESSALQTVSKALDQVVVNEYQVLWRWWAASLAVTLTIVVFILPTFYGFWTLARRTTLSPFETARAFHAPVVSDAPKHLDTPALLKEVGRKNLHTDLVPQTPVSPAAGKERDN